MNIKAISPELVAILLVGAALAGLVLNGQNRIEDRLSVVEKAQAHTSGLLEGLGLTGQVPSRRNVDGTTSAERPE